MIPLPLTILLVLSSLAALHYLLRSWPRTAAAFSAFVVLLLALIVIDPTGLFYRESGISSAALTVEQQNLSFALTSENRPILLVILLLSSLTLALSTLTRQGFLFGPLGLLLTAGYSAHVLLVDAPISPLLLTPTFLAILTTLAVLMLQDGRLGTTEGPMRFLLPPVLALPFFLLAVWNLNQLPLPGEDTIPELLAGQLLTLGILLLLAPVPLHSALPATAEGAQPLATSWTLLLYQLAVLGLIAVVEGRFPMILLRSNFDLWLTGAGVLTALWAGLAAAGAGHPGRLWGYAILHDWGLILIILAAPGPSRWTLVLILFILRIVSIMAGAAGLSQLHQATGSLETSRLRGIGSRLPWSSVLFLLGSLGLAGFPLTAGFTGHWAALQVVAELDWRVAAVVLLSSTGVVLGFVRLVRILFVRRARPDIPVEPFFSVLFAGLVILLVSSLTIAPQLLEGPLALLTPAF